ncbi:hypothetical protein V6N13_111959 [Hibiscus sabdariffa]
MTTSFELATTWACLCLSVGIVRSRSAPLVPERAHHPVKLDLPSTLSSDKPFGVEIRLKVRSAASDDSVLFDDDDLDLLEEDCSRHTQVPNPPATTVSSPTPSPIQLPAESYGLWMLVERRKSRTIRTNSTSRPNDVPRVSQSRFNPLFSGNDHGHTPDISVATDSVESPAKHSEPAGGVTAPVIESAVEPVLETPTDTPTSVSELIVVPSDNKSKAKGKVTGGVRKHNSNVLGSRNLNIMPLKNSIGVHSSSSKISKGRHSHPVLNPEKHMTLTLDPTAPPISVTQNVQQSARLTADSSSMNATSVHTGSTTSDMHSGRSAMTE